MDTSTELIRDFVNTLHKDLNGDEEDLARPAALADWLAGHGLLESGRATARDLAHAVELREALRRLLLANNDVEVETAGAWSTLDEAARRRSPPEPPGSRARSAASPQPCTSPSPTARGGA